jgi:hypothetical protein
LNLGLGQDFTRDPNELAKLIADDATGEKGLGDKKPP